MISYADILLMLVLAVMAVVLLWAFFVLNSKKPDEVPNVIDLLEQMLGKHDSNE